MKMKSLILAFGLILVVVIAGAVAAQNSGGFVGIRLQDGDDGVVIREVLEGSPAADAGLQVDDVITAVNGDAVTQAADVAAAGACWANAEGRNRADNKAAQRSKVGSESAFMVWVGRG